MCQSSRIRVGLNPNLTQPVAIPIQFASWTKEALISKSTVICHNSIYLSMFFFFFFILKLIMIFNLDICTFNTFRHVHPVQATTKIMGTGQCTALHYVSNEHLLS